MTTLKNIFEKPVDRWIEGVIKADDEAGLRLEVEEYVLTNEVEKRLESFLDAYNNYEGANGVWVSGFFGSGKSHLLKILALLLENRRIDDVSTLDMFLPKCKDNEILRGDIKRAVAIPSKSILFNIDQKADIISKTQVDALLAVFVKVFDEMCGYYGKQGHIAQFERDLDSRGLYEQFKAAYETAAGKSWQKGREQALLESKGIAGAYAQVVGGDEASAMGILDKYRNQYRVSIEDFAEEVNAYVTRQPSGFRLNFFVDEVGQYIAENIKLMTNLQTIAESLATKCRGRAWVIVTAQEDMTSVIGEMSLQQSNDFTKIQARFASRMKLTSADVAEVIQKRLLMKNDEGIRLLTDIYHKETNNFKTLFDFADGSQTYRNFQDRDHFIYSYPFIPYQFALFQSAIQSLSQHNAFEGKHSSVGERSMLGVFQQVAIQIGSHRIGQLATFDLMFEGIRTALKANIQRAVLSAEKHLDSTFAIRLLKTLFLVKYVKEFKPTVRNLCVLMLDTFSQDLPVLRKEIEAALALLEQQTYIQRNGEFFEYLTDEEKDIEQEIKNTEVESADVAAELEKIIFDHVIKIRKIRYTENGRDYPYSRKIDDRLHGREHELTLHVVTPFYENTDNEFILQSHTLGRDELMMVLPADDRLVHDILMYKRTEKYIRQNISITQREAVKRILTDKGFRNQERYADLQQLVKALFVQAKFFTAGQSIELKSEDPQSRVTHGFHELISRTYPNLRMLRGIAYTENDIIKCLKRTQDSLFGGDVTTLAESEQEMLAHIQSNNRGGVRTTLKSLLEKFERKPYGWYYPAVLCTLANLCARGKVEVRTDGELLEDEALERALRNTHNHANVVLDPQIDFPPSQVRRLKEFYEDFFDSPPHAGEAKALGKETGAAPENLMQELALLASQSSQYPFLNALTPVLERLKELTGRPYTWYLTGLPHQEDALHEIKEGVIDPVRNFMAGPQKAIFDNARKFVQHQEPNFDYIREKNVGPEGGISENLEKDAWAQTPDALMQALIDPECYKGSRIQQVKVLVETLQDKVSARVDQEMAKAKDAADALKERLVGMAEFAVLTVEQQKQISRSFNEFSESIDRQKLIAVIRDILRRFEEKDYPRLLSQMVSWAQSKAGQHRPTDSDPDKDFGKEANEATPASGKPEPTVEYISGRTVTVAFDKVWLADEMDVDRYIKAMREALMTEIRKGKRIQI